MATTVEYSIPIDKLSPLIHHGKKMVQNDGLKIMPRRIRDFEFVYITKGKGRYSLLGNNIEYCENSLLLTPPHLLHSYEPLGSVEYLFVHFDFFYGFSDLFTEYQNKTDEAIPIAVCVEALELPLFSTKVPFGFTTAMENLINLLTNAAPETKIFLQLRAKALLLEMLTFLLTTQNHVYNAKDMPYFFRSIDYIRNNYAKKITVGEMASRAGLCEAHFIVKFGKTFGITPQQYLESIRINKAKELMIDKTIKLSEISERVGFSDAFYFSKVFKKREGMAPAQFRLLRIN